MADECFILRLQITKNAKAVPEKVFFFRLHTEDST